MQLRFQQPACPGKVLVSAHRALAGRCPLYPLAWSRKRLHPVQTVSVLLHRIQASVPVSVPALDGAWTCLLAFVFPPSHPPVSGHRKAAAGYGCHHCGAGVVPGVRNWCGGHRGVRAHCFSAGAASVPGSRPAWFSSRHAAVACRPLASGSPRSCVDRQLNVSVDRNHACVHSPAATSAARAACSCPAASARTFQAARSSHLPLSEPQRDRRYASGNLSARHPRSVA